MEIPKNIDGLLNVGVSRRALHPALLAAMLSAQVGCKPFENADEVPPMSCAANLVEEDKNQGSGRIELTSGVDAGEEEINGNRCVTRNYIAVGPDLEPLSDERVSKLLDSWLVGFAYEEDKGLVNAFEDESIVRGYLSDECSSGNFCASVCPEWEGPSEFVLTDSCTWVVGIDGKSTDSFPGLSEDETE